MPLIWLPWARPAVPSVVPAARKSGWRAGGCDRARRAGAGMAEAGRQAAEARCRRRMGSARARRRGRGPPSSTAPRYRPTGRPTARRRDRLAVGRPERCGGRGSRASAAPVLVPQAFAAAAARRAPRKSSVSLTTACAAMGALVLALMIWRVDVVRLLPQTAAFYKMVGLEVNLRGLMFKDVKITLRDRGRQAGAGDRGRDHRRGRASRSICRGCASASATRRARRSTPGMRCWSSPC